MNLNFSQVLSGFVGNQNLFTSYGFNNSPDDHEEGQVIEIGEGVAVNIRESETEGHYVVNSNSCE